MSAQVMSAASTMSPMITARLWRSGAGPEELPQDMTATTADGVIVLTVDATLDAAGAVHPELQRMCGNELTLDMVEDLLDPDPDELPEVKEYGVGGCLRKVSSFSVRSPEQGHGDDRELVFEPVEFLAGERWLICHWQPCNAYRLGRVEPRGAELQSRDHIEKEVAKRWRDQRGKTSGDLGIFFLYELALQYSKARKALWKWLDDWEQDFYDHITDSDPIQLVKPLTELHRLHGELHRRLAGLNIPRDCADTGWFADVTPGHMAQHVDKMINRSMSNLRSFSDSLRQAVGLTQSYATMRHFAVAEEQKTLAVQQQAQEVEQQAQTERLQQGFQLVASILLVPTLIAGIYGANTLLPGGGEWSGFIAMVTLMVLGSATMYFALERDRVGDVFGPLQRFGHSASHMREPVARVFRRQGRQKSRGGMVSPVGPGQPPVGEAKPVMVQTEVHDAV